jgi:hypothetical protein
MAAALARSGHGRRMHCDLVRAQGTAFSTTILTGPGGASGQTGNTLADVRSAVRNPCLHIHMAGAARGGALPDTLTQV